MSKASDFFGGGGGGVYVIPQLPLPLSNVGRGSTTKYTTALDGTNVDQLVIPDTAYNPFRGKNGFATIWSATCSGFGGTSWLAFGASWLDSVNGLLWVFAVDSSTTPDTLITGHVNIETGATTIVGSSIFGDDPSGALLIDGAAVHRANIDTGDFTIETYDRSITVNSLGAITNDVVSNLTDYKGGYSSLDGTIFLQYIHTHGVINKLYLTKNDTSITVPLPPALIANSYISDTNVVGACKIRAVALGDKVGLYSDVDDCSFFNTFDRVEFDTWLSEVGTLGGVV